MKTIKKLTFNWHQTGSLQDGIGEDYSYYEVGMRVGTTNVIGIREHSAAGDGDRWFYDVEFEDGSYDRIFNPNTVQFIKQ